MKRAAILILAVLLCLAFAACGAEKDQTVEYLPELLRGQTFLYDELEDGSGSALYSLMFTDSGYRLYRDGGTGILAEGDVTVSEGKALIFAQGDETYPGSYTGSAFESPSVTFTWEGKTMRFTPTSESAEYVYASCLGVFEGRVGESDAVLILERWFEYYLYVDGTLHRGTYEIYSDGQIVFTPQTGESCTGTVENSGDASAMRITLELDSRRAEFTCGQALASYQAAHAMGSYTLSLFQEDVFVIHGVDGLVKAMGTMSYSGGAGTAVYFPRSITGDAELDQRFSVAFTVTDDGFLFPDSTRLLPRSGNIDQDTGLASYWSAGTVLEFIRQSRSTTQTLISYPGREEGYSAEDIPVLVSSGENSGILRQTMPSLGTARPLVLLIDFPDQHRPRFITPEAVEEALFDLEDPDSLSAYYFRSSYGNLTIDGTVLDWYRMEKERDAYDSDKEIMGEVLRYYIREQGLDLSEYDANADGSVDALYVLWAGNMDAGDGMWSGAYRSSWGTSPEEWGTAVTGYIFVPGTTVWSSVPPLRCNVNSLTHETGHLLGLNDYYSYDTTDRDDSARAYTGGALEGGLGGMDMMDVNMGDHNAFSKWLLGWLRPQVVEYEQIQQLGEAGQTYTLRPSNEHADALFIKLQSAEDLFTEMLVVEVVSPTMNAAEFTRLKEPVVRILHVDASLDEAGLEGNWRAYGFRFDNSYTSTKFISIVEADGLDQTLGYLPGASGSKLSYDPADYFRAGDVLTPNTYPNTNGYDALGNATVYNGLSISVESISETGEAVVRLCWEEAAPTLEITEVTPEPVAVPYRADSLTAVPADTGEITVSFDRAIVPAAEDVLSKIRVLSGNALISGFSLELEGNRLRIGFEEGLEPDQDYTLVIPAGILTDAAGSGVTNLYHSIFGFVTEESYQEEKR